MGIISTIAGFFGFGVGISIGLVIGYFLFIYTQSTHVQDPVIRPLAEQDTETLQSLIQEIPIWVKSPDHDRVDWLNKFIETMWPYLNKAICKQVKTIAEPIIAEQIPNYKIDSVQFEALSLGCLPPAFTGWADPVIRPLAEQDTETLQSLIQEIPIWVKSPDHDRVDWLNKFIETMWPYLNKAICKQVKTIAEPIIAEQIPNYKIDSVQFEALSLGCLPPAFTGMKVYTTDDKELIMEPTLKWAGNPNILVAAKAFGMRATVQVVDLQVFVFPRITLKPLVPTFPCFAKILVSLMEKPHVDFGLKLLGADAMSIPGLYSFVQGIIKEQVANMYLWPKTLEVVIMDPTKAMKRPVGILNVKVVRAMKLKKKDLLGASDPYVKLKISEDKLPSKKTTVKHKNLNPEWNEEFSIVVKDPESQTLDLVVYDWDQVGKHERMGMNVIHVKDLKPEETKVLTLDLLKNMDPDNIQNEKSRGQLIVEAMYKPFDDDDRPADSEDSEVQKAPEGTPDGGGLLVVIVHEGQDLEGKHHTNPSVRLLFRGEEKRTKVMKKNRDPKWDEEFQFMLEEPPTDDKIHVEVVSTSKRMGLLHPKDFLGYVDISLADVVSNKRINERYQLIDSKNGTVQIEMQWRTSS